MNFLASRRRASALLATSFLFSTGAWCVGAHAQQAPDAAAQAAHAQEEQLAPIDVTATEGKNTKGYVATSTAVATKTDTPLIDIPQSISVLTQEFIKDQNFQSLTDVTRYVPGVAVHQGEGNRDELVIRGVDSSANFYVNGFRDDVQYFRDLYNTQSIEVLKGPSALTFGRGAGGGLVNRTLKEADGRRVYEATAQTGSWGDRRFSLDAGQAISEGLAVRLNTFYEGTDTFRNYGKIERYGFNPTVTLKPGDNTTVKLSYEFYHDFRLADRGNPSVQVGAAPATRFNPTVPFVSDFSNFFGSPIYNYAHVQVQTGMAVIEHDFGDGLKVKNATIYADYNRGYQNVYPGGPADPVAQTLALNAYNNTTNRENAFNQTDFTYKAQTGPVFHTLAFGTEFGRQTGLSRRNTGFFDPAGTQRSVIVNPFDPSFFGNVYFIHQATDANSKYRLNVSSAYAQDQIDVTRWLQFIAGARFDRFDLSALDQNTQTSRSRTDDKVSPRAGIVIKPVENVSIYGAYSISYLPASGDQFSTLTPGTVIIQPQKFENKEVGVKWNIFPQLQFTAAAYDLVRSNQPIADPNNAGFFLLSGRSKIKGVEFGLNGHITDNWQMAGGYAYTDARIASNTSATVVAGNRIQLVPYNQFSLWNKYQFDPKWAAAVGIIHFSDSFASSDDTVRLPGFTRFDAALYLTLDKTWSGQFNIENIFNKGYWATADGNNNISPGQSRTFRVALTAKL
ncbi:MAG TPA: TonB-dependent siderophore receptor [Xanthobacteraceae bacterium]|jgi:catecholate siderophore receptor|nr:TonB-dependent siderophore receptor [Xanthobacteraceae bacterium]